MLEGLGKCHIVKAFSFSRQYPDFLFPGKTQYVTPEDEAMPVEADAILDTINPITWVRTARAAGLGLNAGHDLSLENLAYFIQTIPWTDEVSIGHALISDALYMGLEKTIQAYLSQIRKK